MELDEALSLGDELGASLGSCSPSTVGDRLEEELNLLLGKPLSNDDDRAKVGEPVGVELGAALGGELGEELGLELGPPLREELGPALGAALRHMEKCSVQH
jgi:hypothetical protein